MFKKILWLEWKSFFRSAAFSQKLAIKILLGLAALYFAACFLVMGVGAFYIIEDLTKSDPMLIVSQFLIYYFLFDLVFRQMLQKLPVMNIRPMLILPVTRSYVVHFSLAKTSISYFNVLHYFFFLPFTIVLFIEGYDPLSVTLWFVSMTALIYFNNYLNILIANKDGLFYTFIAALGVIAASQYFGLFDVTIFTKPLFYALYNQPVTFLVPVALVVGTYYMTYKYLLGQLYLDVGLKQEVAVAETENYTWLNKYGTLGSFLKNDIRMIRRNKRSKTTATMSVLFLFYGLLFFNGAIDAYDNPAMHMFAGIFVSGGFLLSFGQFVPSWDSAYYPLMMTQNVPYRDYISSKWWLMVIGTLVATILGSFYLYFGLEIYLIVVAAAIYNIGVNSYLVLWGGAYTKTPIDLTSAKGAFGDRKAFNAKTLLISLPQLLLPMGVFLAGKAFLGTYEGIAAVALLGIIGFLFRDKMFNLIVKTYKTEKYAALAAYKEKN